MLEYVQKFMEERQAVGENTKEMEERDNLINSILLQTYPLKPGAVPKHVK